MLKRGFQNTEYIINFCLLIINLLQILNDRMNTMKSENEEAIKKKIIQSTRFRKAIPKIEEAVKSAKNLISEKIPLLIGCIDKRVILFYM